MPEDIIEKNWNRFFLLEEDIFGTVPVWSSGSQHIFIFAQGYTQEQLEREENVESIQLNVQYQPTATRKART